jgi:phage FluMu gp28-like protein
MPEVAIPRPHPRQLEVIQQRKRFNVVCCGRRWGKTVIGLDRVVHPVLGGNSAAWFADTYRTLGEAFRILTQTFRPMILRLNQSEHRIELIGGGLLECWSLDNPDAGRGRAYHMVVIDEAAKVQDLEHAWEQSIRPMLADYQGDAWFLSTPKGTANYFHSLYQRGQDPKQEEWASWRMPTSTNPYIKPAEIEVARRDLTDLAFAQEWLAEFVSWAGQIFRRITDAVKPINQTGAAMIGVDWGRTGDYTVFTAVSQTGQVLEIDRFRGIEYAFQRDRLAAFWKRQGSRAYIIAEHNAMGGPVIEQLLADRLPVIPFVTTNATKAAAIQALALAFERGSISIPNDPVLIGELQAFEGKALPTGLMRYAAPAGLHDDCVMSLAMAWAGLVRPKDRQLFIDPNSGDYTDDVPEYRISAI